MKKTKFFITAGAITLAITAIFATKPAKTFTGATSAFFRNAGGVWVTLFAFATAGNSKLTTTSTNNKVAYFNTINATSPGYQIYATAATTTPLYIP